MVKFDRGDANGQSKLKEEMQGSQGANIKEGSFVELRGRPWLVEGLRGNPDNLQTLSLSCIADDAQGERIDLALSRLKQGFNSPRERQSFQ